MGQPYTGLRRFHRAAENFGNFLIGKISPIAQDGCLTQHGRKVLNSIPNCVADFFFRRSLFGSWLGILWTLPVPKPCGEREGWCMALSKDVPASAYSDRMKPSGEFTPA